MKLQAETINKLHEEPTESNHSYDDFNVSKSTISNDRYNVSTENSLKRVTFIHKNKSKTFNKTLFPFRLCVQSAKKFA